MAEWETGESMDVAIERAADGWWIRHGTDGVENIGPYSTKAEAEEDYRGVKRFLQDNHGISWRLAKSGEQPEKRRQSVLFAGLDCPDGTQDLFPTDGEKP